jgi:hypothetical protein
MATSNTFRRITVSRYLTYIKVGLARNERH